VHLWYDVGLANGLGYKTGSKVEISATIKIVAYDDV